MGVPKVKLLLILLSTIFLPPSTQHPDDESCLTHLFNSFQDPNKNLHNWTTLTFSNPCSDFTSNLLGATCNNARIYKLSLRSLGLHGTISPYISNCTNLQSLDLSNNSLTGPLPDDLHRLLNLAVLNLSVNRLSGTIPNSLPMCLYLNVIDLHDNLFQGAIPVQIGSLVRLTVFDVSNNKLAGVIPGNLGRFNVSSFMGNKGLYGYPLGARKSKGLSVLAIVGIGLGSGLVSLGFSFTVVCVWLRAQEKKRAEEEHEGKISLPDY